MSKKHKLGLDSSSLRGAFVFARLCAAFWMLKSSGVWSRRCIGYCTLRSARLKSKVCCRQGAGVPELVKGAGLKLRCIVLRGFKSHPLHHYVRKLGFSLTKVHPNAPSKPSGESFVMQTTPAITFSGSRISTRIFDAIVSRREFLEEIFFSTASCRNS